MEREIISENDAELVTGGSIVFNADHTTCGRNCNNQYKVLDYSKVHKFIVENCTKMSEKQMLNKMVANGWLVSL